MPTITPLPVYGWSSDVALCTMSMPVSALATSSMGCGDAVTCTYSTPSAPAMLSIFDIATLTVAVLPKMLIGVSPNCCQLVFPGVMVTYAVTVLSSCLLALVPMFSSPCTIMAVLGDMLFCAVRPVGMAAMATPIIYIYSLFMV